LRRESRSSSSLPSGGIADSSLTIDREPRRGVSLANSVRGRVPRMTRSARGPRQTCSGGLCLLALADFRVVFFDLLAHLDDDRVERCGIVDGQLREALAVEANLSQAEAVNQAAIAQAPHLGGGCEPDDEELAEFALAGPPITKGEHPGTNQCFLCGAKQPAPS